MVKNVNTIIFDWNGTLLNDMAVCIEAMNAIMGPRGLEPLTPEKYKQIFTFPVRDYYQTAGFDFSKEPFEIPAMEFINAYHNLISKATLFAEVKSVLEQNRQNGLRQIILSAMEHDALVAMVKQFGIFEYFQAIQGINNHFAGGKIEQGKLLIAEHVINPETTVLIGDTLHDFEVAQALGVRCILVSYGHQHKARLKQAGAPIADSLHKAVALI